LAQQIPSDQLEISDDAAYYTAADAERLFVLPSTALPRSHGHSVVFGPRGAGKTHLLKTLLARWSREPQFLPLYIELGEEQWIASIAGEVELDSTAPLSPRDRAMVECMWLALCHSIASRCFDRLPADALLPVLSRVTPGIDSLGSWSDRIHSRIQELLKRGRGAVAGRDDTSAIAHRLGIELSRVSGQRLLILMDQIDRMAGPLLEPILSLLQKASGYSFVLASRPCPAAPAPTPVPQGVGGGDNYKVFAVGREGDLRKQAEIIEELYDRLGQAGRGASAWAERTSRELRPRIGLIAALTWPTLRDAVSLFIDYESRRASGNTEGEAFAAAIKHVQRECQANAEDHISAWCENPRGLIESWRKRVATETRNEAVRAQVKLIRTRIDVGVPAPAERFLRVALKSGVLTSPDSAAYLGDRIPDIYEIPPLLTVPEGVVPSPRSLDRTVIWEVLPDEIAIWAKRGAGRQNHGPRTAFVSVHTGSPERRGAVGDSRLFRALEDGIGGDVLLRSQDDLGPSIVATELRDMIRTSGLVVCDLTVPRREIFLEYGWAIGFFKQVVQVTESRASTHIAPWARVLNTFHYGNDSDRRTLCRSVVGALNSPSEPTRTWRASPDGSAIDVFAHSENVTFAGTSTDITKARHEYDSHLKNLKFRPTYMTLDPLNSQMLFELIPAVRAAGTLVLMLNDDEEIDFLTCVAGGIFTSRPFIRVAGTAKLARQPVLLDESSYMVGSQLLRQLPDVKSARSWKDLSVRVADRVLAVGSWQSSVRKRRRRR
jgi:hypothetical protein